MSISSYSSYLDYWFKRQYVYNGIYVYQISNGEKVITTPHIDSSNEDDENIKTIAEKVIDFLKTVLGFIKVPDAFLAADVEVATLSMNYTRETFTIIVKFKIIYLGGIKSELT